MPWTWPRAVDLVSYLPLQVAIDQDLPCYFMSVQVTYKEDRPPVKSRIGQIKGGDIEWKIKAPRRRALQLACSVNPKERSYTQQEIFDSLAETGAPTKDVTIGGRGSIRKIPKSLESEPVFDGKERIYHNEVASAWRGEKAIATRKPNRIAKHELILHGFSPKQIPLYKMQSVFNTRAILLDAGNTIEGYNALVDLRSRKNYILPLSRELVRDKLCRDVALPRPQILESVDGRRVTVRLYLLERYHELITLAQMK